MHTNVCIPFEYGVRAGDCQSGLSSPLVQSNSGKAGGQKEAFIVTRTSLNGKLDMKCIELSLKKLQFSEAFHLSQVEFAVFLFLGTETRELC